ncbi:MULTISPECIES: PilZ domain-containing protein [unclassified Salinivibrio]|uniref:PilZ domain-containing protein n=1 Tax=unclassified Salinivibrio TaxID=2636825 RepID=UPI00128E18B7|nr:MULTISPECIES: PilZ domain-containing protein [unclassified Salinivibrio]MPS30937.1 PilZ domain-containing protein [Salinivibrio sp. VYel7]MPX92338.1 PilZ domain-containing protein [Salinivibrio sp. VYel9]MPX97086.1 PilZ domain-containing protein [Salinivibrio sp. VYel6]MPX98570.1 PilZ domain-containing protein [Salinivibrio sp. VYel4]MPY01729.1 PilZ domain-containing protein [Salinivibrio sp. VYel5]
MPRKEQLNAIDKNQEAIALAVTHAVLKLGVATLVRVHIQTPTKALFRFNGLLIGSDGQRFCYLQLPKLSSQQKKQYFGAGYSLRLHGVSADGSLIRFGGKVQGLMEAHHTLLCVELVRDGANATPLRQDKRFNVELSAALNIDGKASVPVTIHDLSVGGCLFSYRAIGLQIDEEKSAALSLTGIPASQALTMSGVILSHRLKGERYHCGLKFDDRSKSRSAWLVTNLDYDGEQYRLSIPHNDGELTSSLSI